MPITTEILYKLATKAGSAGNSQAQADPNASLGKYVSTSAFVTATLGNLFDAVTGDENAGEAVDYRCLFIHNSHSTLTLIDPKLWITGQEAGGAFWIRRTATDSAAQNDDGVSFRVEGDTEE